MMTIAFGCEQLARQSRDDLAGYSVQEGVFRYCGLGAGTHRPLGFFDAFKNKRCPAHARGVYFGFQQNDDNDGLKAGLLRCRQVGDAKFASVPNECAVTVMSKMHQLSGFDASKCT
jgi:hypothetical protein